MVFNKGYVMTEEHKRHISEANKGRIIDDNWKKNMSLARIGHVYSDETRNKISLTMKGRLFSKEHKKHLSESLKGVSRPYVSLRQLGTHHTEETKLRISSGVKIAYNQPELHDKLRQTRARQIFPRKDTIIEVITENWLKENNIIFKKHKVFQMTNGSYHQVDFYIPLYDKVIECDGDYWHLVRPGAKERDALIDESLREQGISVIRLLGSDILSGNAFNSLTEMF